MLGTVGAQKNQYLSESDSDPQAAALLKKMQGVFQDAPVQLSFRMTLSYPGEDPIVQNGMLVQQGNMYYVKTEETQIWCDGALRWIMMEGTREVNLYSAKDDEHPGPTGLISEYTGDGFVAAMAGEEHPPGQAKRLLIELKPVDRNSEIAKVRIAAKQNGEPVKMEIFEKSATRTVLEVEALSRPAARGASYFTFDKTKYPGVHIEDLRID